MNHRRLQLQLLLLLVARLPCLGDNYFEVNFQNRSDSEQCVQRGILHFLLNVADSLPRQSGLLSQHVQGKSAFFACLF